MKIKWFKKRGGDAHTSGVLPDALQSPYVSLVEDCDGVLFTFVFSLNFYHLFRIFLSFYFRLCLLKIQRPCLLEVLCLSVFFLFSFFLHFRFFYTLPSFPKPTCNVLEARTPNKSIGRGHFVGEVTPSHNLNYNFFTGKPR